MTRIRLLLLVGLVVCSILVTAYTQEKQVPAEQHHSSDPIAAIGHGAILGPDGKQIELTPKSIQMIQEYYINSLLNQMETRRDKLKRGDATIEATRKAIAGAVEDKILANALLLDWLLERVKPEKLALITIANNALRWHYVLKIQKDAVLPKDKVWAKGLKPDVAKRLEKLLGIKILYVTNAGGAEYCTECQNAGVPVPNFMFGSEWRFVGEVEGEFLSPDGRTELWIHESQSPPGVCLALPRFSDGSNRASLFGVICLGTQTSKACFFDNPKGTLFQRDVQINFRESFVGGRDLVANAQGVCSDCHAGENPYIVHPEKPAFAGLQSRLQPMAWHDPLVDATWPQNPGPTVQLEAVSSTGRCDSCHQVGFAGRFPEISTQLSGYCGVVLGTAAGTSSRRTMPMPVGTADRNQFINHINSLTSSCSAAPSGSGVVVDVDYKEDPGVLSAPIVIDPIYGCATTVGVRGAVLNAKVVLKVNNTAVGTIDPARNPYFVEFKGLADLKPGDQVVATQEKDGATAESAAITVRDHKVDFPAGLPAPSVDPVLIYECAEVISIRHVPSANVTIHTNGGDSVVRGGGSNGWTLFRPGKVPFEIGDDFTAEQSLCADTSPPSPAAIATAVAAPTSIPPATFNPPTPFNGQELALLESLTHGTKTNVGEQSQGDLGSFSTSISWYRDFDVATPLGRPLVTGDRLTALQALCALKSQSETPAALSCDDLPAPKIQHPAVGANYVVVSQSVPGARIRVYDAADKEIGDGSGTIIMLTRTITGTDTLTVVQQVGDCTSKTGYRVSVRNPKNG